MMLRMTAATPASPSDLVPALGHDLADRRIAILRHIAAGHSISQAAREAGVSYKAAWQALDVLTNLAGRALVERSVGGAGGGGARITEAGQSLLAMADALEQARAQVLQRFGGPAGVSPAAPGLGLGLRTSMRNLWPCRVGALQAQEIGRAHVNSSHSQISYAVFCLKKKKKPTTPTAHSPRATTSSPRGPC